MKPDIEDLYERLAPHELAALAFHYSAIPGDTQREIQRIKDAVPRRTYHELDGHFRDSILAFGNLASLWGIVYWQLRCREMATISYISITEKRHGEARAIQLGVDNLRKIEGRLLALDVVLEDICTEHGIDPADVRRLTEAVPYKPTTNSDILIADPEFREEFHAQLSQLLPAHKPGGGTGAA